MLKYLWCFSLTHRHLPPVYPPSGTFPFLIRPTRYPDLDRTSELLTECFYDLTGWKRWLIPLFRLGIYEDLRHRWMVDSPHYVCLVAIDPSPNSAQGNESEDGDRIVGTVELGLRYPGLWQSRSTNYLYISNLAVLPPYRQRGIARQLLTTCEQTAIEWGFSELYLHVLENNPNAKNLYQQLGYHLHSVEFSLGHWLLNHPRQLFLRKKLSASRSRPSISSEI